MDGNCKSGRDFVRYFVYLYVFFKPIPYNLQPHHYVQQSYIRVLKPWHHHWKLSLLWWKRQLCVLCVPGCWGGGGHWQVMPYTSTLYAVALSSNHQLCKT